MIFSPRRTLAKPGTISSCDLWIPGKGWYHPISDGMATRQVNFLSRKHLKVGNSLKNIPHETTMNHFWIEYPETFLDPF